MSGRIRSLKPEWLEDEKLAAMGDGARLLSVALILCADDYGNGRAHPLYLASRVWPYGEPSEVLQKVSGGLSDLARIGFVRLYSVKGQSYFHVCNWARHQRVQHPGSPRVPGPGASTQDGLASSSGETHETLAPDLRSPISDQDPEPDSLTRDSGVGNPDHPAAKVRVAWSLQYESKTTKPWDWRTPKQLKLSVELASWLERVGAMHGIEFDRSLETFMAAVFSSEKAAEKHYRFEWVAACREEFWTPPKPKRVHAPDDLSSARKWA